MIETNQPYIKTYDEFGVVSNPITRKNPFRNSGPNRSARRSIGGRLFSNKKGTKLVVSRIGLMSFVKYFKNLQHMKGKTLCHSVE